MVLVLLALSPMVHAQAAHFLVQGEIQSVGDSAATRLSAEIPQGISGLFGALADGRLVVGVGDPVIEPGYDITQGMTLQILDPSGPIVIADDVLRAYPAPLGDDILFITITRDSRLWDGVRVIDMPIDRRASQFAWFPDGRSAAMTSFDPDWSPVRQNNADSTEEFLRMNNSEIHRLALATMTLTPLAVHPEADWGPVISPDGTEMIFNSTRIGGYATIFRLDIATGDLTPLAIPNPGGGYEGNVPVPLVNQVVWHGNELIYATSRPDMSHEVRMVRTDGTGAVSLGDGWQPQLINGGAGVAIITDSGQIVTLTLGEGE